MRRLLATGVMLLVMGSLMASEPPKPMFKTTCPYCNAMVTQAAKTIEVRGSRSVPGGYVQERQGMFKCKPCGKTFTQPLEDKFVPAQPKAKEVK